MKKLLILMLASTFVLVLALTCTACVKDDPLPPKDELAEAIAALPQSASVNFLWDRLGGYWNTTDSLFFAFESEEGATGVSFGIWNSGGLGFGELLDAESQGKYEAALTIRFASRPASEMDDAREEFTVIVYIDLGDLEKDGKIRIKVANHGNGEWYTYAFGGKTSDDAYNSAH